MKPRITSPPEQLYTVECRPARYALHLPCVFDSPQAAALVRKSLDEARPEVKWYVRTHVIPS